MNSTRLGLYIGGGILGVIWLVTLYFLTTSYQSLNLRNFLPILASFVTATATVFLVGVTYIYVKSTKNLVDETRKQQRRDAIVETIIDGLDPLLSELESQSTIDFNESYGVTEYPEYSPKNIDSIIEDYHLVDVEIEIEEGIKNKLTNYDNKWDIYGDTRNELLSELSGDMSERFYKYLSEDEMEDFIESLEEAQTKIDKEAAVAGSRWKEGYLKAPGLVIEDHSKTLAKFVLKPPSEPNSDNITYSEEYLRDNITQREINICPKCIFHTYREFFLGLRDKPEFSDYFNKMENISSQNCELRDELIVKIDTTRGDLMEEYDILNTHLNN